MRDAWIKELKEYAYAHLTQGVPEAAIILKYLDTQDLVSLELLAIGGKDSTKLYRELCRGEIEKFKRVISDAIFSPERLKDLRAYLSEEVI